VQISLDVPRVHVGVITLIVLCLLCAPATGAEIVDHPFLGVTHIKRTETLPRTVTMHIVLVDLTASVEDAAGNTATASGDCIVPHDQRNN